jgi:hypothetical protein
VLTTLAVPFADTSAAALSWWLGEAPDALGELTLRSGLGTLQLHVLGASHQAVATVHDVSVPEVVACRGRADGLPPDVRRDLGRVDYRFSCATRHLGGDRLATVASGLRSWWEDDDRALVAAFPGSPHALTVLAGRAAADGWHWRTWHVYPSSSEVVETRGRLVLR